MYIYYGEIKRDIIVEKEEEVFTTPNSRRIHWWVLTEASMAGQDQAFREDECLSV